MRHLCLARGTHSVGYALCKCHGRVEANDGKLRATCRMVCMTASATSGLEKSNWPCRFQGMESHRYRGKYSVHCRSSGQALEDNCGIGFIVVMVF